jgi:GTP-binding protein EngB required for normal cell division
VASVSSLLISSAASAAEPVDEEFLRSLESSDTKTYFINIKIDKVRKRSNNQSENGGW